MIRVHFFRSGTEYLGFSVSGHAGYDEYGRDIACASVTSAVQLTANALTEVLGLPAQVTVAENEIRLCFENAGMANAAQPYLKALLLHLKLLSEEFEGTIAFID